MELEGKLVYLRPVRLADVKKPYVRWMNDPDVTQYLEARHHHQDSWRIREYVREMKANPYVRFMAIECRLDGCHAGNIKLGPFDPVNMFGDIGIVLDKPYWRRGMGTEAISLMTDYAFKLGFHKVWAGILDGNIGSIRAFAKAGFGVEARLQRQYLVDGVWTDDIIMSKFNPDMEEVPKK